MLMIKLDEIIRKWKTQRDENRLKRIKRIKKKHEKLDPEFKKRLKEGYDAGLELNLQMRAR
ncbi:MAG: hypothetical protein ACTSQE_11630 [Candidatus Heimdallarchaeaceae archaeon]